MSSYGSFALVWVLPVTAFLCSNAVANTIQFGAVLPLSGPGALIDTQFSSQETPDPQFNRRVEQCVRRAWDRIKAARIVVIPAVLFILATSLSHAQTVTKYSQRAETLVGYLAGKTCTYKLLCPQTDIFLMKEDGLLMARHFGGMQGNDGYGESAVDDSATAHCDTANGSTSTFLVRGPSQEWRYFLTDQPGSHEIEARVLSYSGTYRCSPTKDDGKDRSPIDESPPRH